MKRHKHRYATLAKITRIDGANTANIMLITAA